MNERIKELAEKLELPVGLENPQWAYEPVLEKFAELIVKECADYVEHFYGDCAAKTIGCGIKQHFGVKE